MCQLCLAIPTTNAIVRTVIVALIIILLLVGAIYLGLAVRRMLSPNAITRTVSRRGFDGGSYRVHGNLKDPQQAADLLAKLNLRASALVGALHRRYLGYGADIPPTAPAAERTPARVACVRNLVARYNPDNFVENSYLDGSGDSSYCIDKGAILAICLRNRAGAGAVAGKFQDEDTLFFVTLHELTHMTIEAVDHPPIFWSAFRFILEEAEKSPINYISRNFERMPTLYCGININYNPRYDQVLKPLA